MLLYYGQYVGKILNETLPTFGQAIEDQGSLTTLRPTPWDFVTGHLARAMQSYHLALIYAIGIAGALWLFFRHRVYRSATQEAGRGTELSDARRAPTPWQKVWLGGWLLTFPLFTLADFWVDQALKQFWIALPAIAVVAGAWSVAMLLRGRFTGVSSTLVVLVGVTLAWQSVSLWVFRLLFHNQ